MNKKEICPECGHELKMSLYSPKHPEDGPISGSEDDLVCRNYPACSRAEKE